MRSASVAVVAASLFAAVPSGAHPPAPVDEAGRALGGELHSWIHGAKVPVVRGRVRIVRAPCPGHPMFDGCIFPSRPRTIYLLPGLGQARTLLYHELGHIFDLLVLNGRERRRFKRIAGIRRGGWTTGALPPSEWFADGYAKCALRLRLRRRGAAPATAYGYAPTPRQHARVCRLVRAAAKPRGRPPEPPANPPPVIEVAPPPPREAEPGGGEGCTLVDELLTGCEGGSTPGPDVPI